MKLNNLSKGQIGQLKVELRANELGFSVSRPTFDLRYDMILDDKKGNLCRVQIKYCDTEWQHSERKNYHDLLSLELKNNKYSNKDIDLLLVYVPRLDKILAFGPKLFHNKNRMKINLKNKNSKHYFKKFLW